MSDAVRTTGYLLWRGGLLLASSSTLLWLGKWLFALWLLPAMVTWGLALVASGMVLVVVSLLVETRRDERPPTDDEIGVNP